MNIIFYNSKKGVYKMNILAIGNSFSQDATRYLHQIARADGVDIQVINLYIGGCPLSRHYRNMLSEEKAYSSELNGCYTGFSVSLKEALLSRDWDYITFQQVSSQSPDYNTYQPYLGELSAYVKKLSPKAKQLIHQTWAYEKDSARLCTELGYKTPADMLCDIKKAYQMAENEIGAQFTIPSGELFGNMLANGIDSVHRDTFHARLGLGRYALGLLWYRAFTGKDVTGNTFRDFDEPVSEEDILIIKKFVNSAV